MQGQFAPRSSYAAMCTTPRTGIDSITGKAHLDRPGTALDEKNWLRSWTNDLYLWYREVPDQGPANFTSASADLDYFKVLKIPASRTTSGGIVIPKDKFHFHYTTARWEALSQSGVSAGYGATFAFIANRPPRNLIVAYTEPNSPATLAPASLAHGAQILTVDTPTTIAGIKIPGCSVADDFSHALGDTAEGVLSSALSYRANGVCSTGPTGFQVNSRKSAQSYGVTQVSEVPDIEVVKSIWQNNRIYRTQ